MDKAYCEKRKQELREEKKDLIKIVEKIKERYKNRDERQYKNIYEAACSNDFNRLALLMDLQKSFNRIHKDNTNRISINNDELDAVYKIKSIDHTLELFDDLYLDTPYVRFDGDIVITDPCYLVSYKDEKHDEKLETLWNNLLLVKDTLYGDWGCVTINTDTNEKIGRFCADGAMVCVVLLDEVKKLTPDYIPHEEATLIKDFHGEVRIVVEEEFYEYEGKKQKDYVVHVEGRGNTNFKTFQTGF